MKRVLLILVVTLVPLSGLSQSLDDLKGATSSNSMKGITESMGGSISGMLQGGLGLSKDQADGGVGSVLKLASEKLSAGDYDKLAAKIPGADKYLDSAKSLGAVTGSLGDVDGLKNALGSLGISPEMVDKFLPAITEYAGKLGGESTQKLMQQVLGS